MTYDPACDVESLESLRNMRGSSRVHEWKCYCNARDAGSKIDIRRRGEHGIMGLQQQFEQPNRHQRMHHHPSCKPPMPTLQISLARGSLVCDCSSHISFRLPCSISPLPNPTAPSALVQHPFTPSLHARTGHGDRACVIASQLGNFPRFGERHRLCRARYLTIGERAYVWHKIVLEGVMRRRCFLEGRAELAEYVFVAPSN